MISKGINTSAQIDGTQRPEKELKRELSLKSMMISCFAYGSISVDSYEYQKYILPHKKELGEKLFNEVYEEQKEFLNTCKVKSGVYTDSEGCTYNEVISK